MAHSWEVILTSEHVGCSQRRKSGKKRGEVSIFPQTHSNLLCRLTAQMRKQGARLSEDFHKGKNKGKGDHLGRYQWSLLSVLSWSLATHWLCPASWGLFPTYTQAFLHSQGLLTTFFIISSCQCTSFERMFLCPIPDLRANYTPSLPFSTLYITPSETHKHIFYKNEV